MELELALVGSFSLVAMTRYYFLRICVNSGYDARSLGSAYLLMHIFFFWWDISWACRCHEGTYFVRISFLVSTTVCGSAYDTVTSRQVRLPRSYSLTVMRCVPGSQQKNSQADASTLFSTQHTPCYFYHSFSAATHHSFSAAVSAARQNPNNMCEYHLVARMCRRCYRFEDIRRVRRESHIVRGVRLDCSDNPNHRHVLEIFYYGDCYSCVFEDSYDLASGHPSPTCPDIRQLRAGLRTLIPPHERVVYVRLQDGRACHSPGYITMTWADPPWGYDVPDEVSEGDSDHHHNEELESIGGSQDLNMSRGEIEDNNGPNEAETGINPAICDVQDWSDETACDWNDGSNDGSEWNGCSDDETVFGGEDCTASYDAEVEEHSTSLCDTTDPLHQWIVEGGIWRLRDIQVMTVSVPDPDVALDLFATNIFVGFAMQDDETAPDVVDSPGPLRAGPDPTPDVVDSSGPSRAGPDPASDSTESSSGVDPSPDINQSPEVDPDFDVNSSPDSEASTEVGGAFGSGEEALAVD